VSTKAFKFRIYPTNAQIDLIQRTFGCCRYIFNHFLAKRQNVYAETGDTLNFFACCRDLTLLKNELPWLRDVDATALQSALRALDNAFRGFFRRVKKGEKPGYPKFKSKRSNHKSYTAKNTGNNIAFDGFRIKLPKLGWVNAKGYTAINGRIVNATVSQTASGKYFVSLCCLDVDIPQHSKTGTAVGIDVGLRSLIVTSDGKPTANQRYLERSLKKLARLQRRLSRKPKGSKRREKARIGVARMHERIANQRSDALHKLTTELVKEHDIICVREMLIPRMVKNRRFSRSIMDASWGELIRQLTYKAEWHDKQVVVIGDFFASSQLCNECGYQNQNLRDLSIMEWLCPKCYTEHDRDVNAARNMLKQGLKQIT
jgi:putative transposase